MLRLKSLFVVTVLVLATGFAGGARAAGPGSGLAGVDVVRDELGIPHVRARTEGDAYFAMGYLHAQDRLFQMDQSRRQAAGTLAELVGPSALDTDVMLRTLGLGRAAFRSLLASSPKVAGLLWAYAGGVNAWLATHALPAEYAALEIKRIPPWTALDSMAISKLLSFGLSFDTDDITNTERLLAYEAAGRAHGFDGRKLFSEDVMRVEPFAHEPSIRPGERSVPVRAGGPVRWSSGAVRRGAVRRDAVAGAAARWRASQAGSDQGSNVWVVSGRKSASGRPMVASDPHLSLGSPSTFYEAGIELRGTGERLYGVTFPGSPLIVHGHNDDVSWGSTVNPTDVTDIFQEKVVMAGPVPVATVHRGKHEPIQIIPEVYRANQPGNGVPDDVRTVPPGGSVPPATFVVPRHGPLITAPAGSPATALSVQFTGFYATREPEYFLDLSHARNVGDAGRALANFDVGAQNWMFADSSGNIAYHTGAEIPLREDLQAGRVSGLPPYFVRDGGGGNEWIADPGRRAGQAIPYAVLPAAEMDRLVNPRRGWISNANQDPTGQSFDNDPLNELRPGGGIRYITPGHSDGNRNARIRHRIEEALGRDHKISFAGMQRIQSDVKLNDAAVLTPWLVNAMRNAQRPGAAAPLAAFAADGRVREAVRRLAAWDFSTPTGIPEGYDAADVNGRRGAPGQREIDASVAATIYSLWRGQALAVIVDAPLVARGLGAELPEGAQAMTALRHLLRRGGAGASGIRFFAGPADRDVKLLTALKQALDLAASPAFAPAFGGSANLADYRWGKLHRIVFRHTLGGPLSLPPGGGFTDVGPGLPGVATDGGFQTPDASAHNPRAASLNGFMFGSGPARRFVSEPRRSGPRSVQVIPGGESGNPAGPYFGNQLGLWLTDDYHLAPLPTR